jgi:RHH-type transcriptional regulator, proline utilization regulon repressor / proline dehydrogenase / delta 1-pyrroline-5-carboxylate dehydrogenase
MSSSQSLAAAKQCLNDAKNSPPSGTQREAMAIALAAHILNEAAHITTSEERAYQKQIARMVNDSNGKAFMARMSDQCFRSQDPYRVASQLRFILKEYGVPHFLPPLKRLSFWLFKWLGYPLAKMTIPLLRWTLRQQTAKVILPGEPKALAKHMQQRRKERIRLNLNHLGEAILGEAEAKARLDTYLKDLENPAVECISIKISTLYSQISLIGWQNSLDVLSERLKQLYRSAQKNRYILPDGRKISKLVNLDMEEYRDLHLTVALFQRVLDDPEFHQLTAGIVLQSYLPDAFPIQQELTAWARTRVASGGAPIRIRIVKGANLAMEKVEASLKSWPQAPYTKKASVDANYKKMIHYGFESENIKAVKLGIGSHNLFDIAYALLLRAEKKLEDDVTFEMLEGMADPLRKVVQALSKDMLVYCPVATKEEFQYAVAYLIRRLDENTAPENFLRHIFDLTPNSAIWEKQAEAFVNACKASETISQAPRRDQNRFIAPEQPAFDIPFSNEPDTDWSLPQNQKWAQAIINEWSSKQHNTVPLVIGGRLIFAASNFGTGSDPSFPEKPLYRYALADEKDCDLAIETAIKGHQKWSHRPLQERCQIIESIAQQLRSYRADLIGAMIADTGKTMQEADSEVSETIDFACYYRRSVEELHSLNDIQWHSKGPVLVAPPWNFPCSIPAGGILSALAAGNSVIFKPAPESVLVGWQLAQIFWKAGIDQETLQFFCCEDDPIGTRLIQDPRIAAVVLTGATATAKHFLKMRPGIDLIAETGGKNAMIITRMADRDLAIKDLLQSAFGHSGQKCSACSLAILEKEIYEDPHFKKQLADAAASLIADSPWNLSARINPLVGTPRAHLLKALTTLEEGEEWLLQPKQELINPNLWSPGIKWGVKRGSFTHQTEFFGPVLGVLCAKDLEEAISIANDTPYGLTTGIHTLDSREVDYWKEKIIAGNCYVNRTITGAIVRRQPFGGCKESSFGKGAKAGGPNYIIQLMQAVQKKLPEEQEELHPSIAKLDSKLDKSSWTPEESALWTASLNSYSFYWNHYFSKPHDPNRILGQDNFLCYVPHPYTVRIDQKTPILDTMRLIAAALICKTNLEVSCPIDYNISSLGNKLPQIRGVTFISETEEQLIERISRNSIKKMRLLDSPSLDLQKACADAASSLIVAPVLANGRIELLHFLREVSYSIDYHRYGYLGLRETNNHS